jgi:hypothetical protein
MDIVLLKPYSKNPPIGVPLLLLTVDYRWAIGKCYIVGSKLYFDATGPGFGCEGARKELFMGYLELPTKD